MKRRSFIKNSAVAAVGLAAHPLLPPGGARIAPRRAGGQEVKTVFPGEDLRIVELSGQPLQRGWAHGESLREEIRAQLDVWMEDLGRSGGGASGKILDAFLEETDFLPAVRKWSPGLLEELKGMSEGSGIPFKTLYGFQLWDEYWWYARKKRAGLPLAERHHCTIGGVFNQPGLPPLLGTNMDLPGWTDGFGVLLRIRHRDPDLSSYIFTVAGYLGACGLSSRAVGQSGNTVLELNSHPAGLPCAYIVRSLLEKPDYPSAVRFLREIRHASGQNYVIGGPRQVASFECSANKVRQYIPYPGANVVYHTNHPIVNDDRSEDEAILAKFPDERDGMLRNSKVRLAAMEKRLKNAPGPVTVETLKEALASQDDPANPVCLTRPGKGKGNGQRCLIYELSEPPVLHFASGPARLAKFKIFKFV